MTTNTAKIPVQQSFCITCADTIRKALLDIQDISNVYLYPKESLIVFNFIRANEVSKALNVLSDLGYPERGEIVNRPNHPSFPCCSEIPNPHLKV